MADVTVSYKDSTVCEMSDSGTITLNTAGNFCEADILISYYAGVAYVGASWPAGSTCVCTDGTTTLTADDTSGAFVFSLPNTGNWTVSCTDGSQTASQSITVAANHVYAVSLAYFRLEPFNSTSDENFVKLIRAAHNGEIDLHVDAGWNLGDKRAIQISAFTGGGMVAHAAQTIDIAISSFSDYENCGCVLQFDFVNALADGNRMEASDINTNGYGRSEMYITTLPALVNALPAYLRGLLIEFSCKASAGNMSSKIETVNGNKLALRSEVEIIGTTKSSFAGEGSQILYYATSDNRIKKRGHSGSASSWWERSPYKFNTDGFCRVLSSGNSSSGSTSSAFGVAPFGCI